MQVSEEQEQQQERDKLKEAKYKIFELEEQMIEAWELYNKIKNGEQVVHINVEQLYWQIAFLREQQEMYARVTLKNGKIVRIEAATE